MGKINERFEYDELTGESTLIQTYDVDPTLKRVEMLREVGTTPMSDARHVGTIPMALMQEWCREAGIDFSKEGAWDAANEVMHKKILSGEFDKLRVWTGTYKWDV